MHNEFTSIIEPDGEWFVAYSPEIPGANGQGRSPEDARENLAEAIALILEDRREVGPTLDEREAEAWDREIEHDAASGKLDKLFEKSMADHRAGESREC